jgi:hypothetical protein
MDKTYFIYRYVRLDTNQPFYIGMGTKKEYNNNGYLLRSTRSIYPRAFCKDRNLMCLSIMDKAGYDTEIIYETNDRSHAEEKEKEFISLYGVVSNGNGTLVNLTMGGTKFIPTKLYSERSVYERKKKNVFYGTRAKKTYMYDVEGNFIEEFPLLKSFYYKYGLGDKDGSGISQSIRLKMSCYGYLFSFEKKDKLDVSKYGKLTPNFHIVKYNMNNNPVKIYKCMQDVANDLNVEVHIIYNRVHRGAAINDFIYKKVPVHELPKIN